MAETVVMPCLQDSISLLQHHGGHLSYENAGSDLRTVSRVTLPLSDILHVKLSVLTAPQAVSIRAPLPTVCRQ